MKKTINRIGEIAGRTMFRMAGLTACFYLAKFLLDYRVDRGFLTISTIWAGLWALCEILWMVYERIPPEERDDDPTSW
jgi:hypothetical protein